MTKKQKKEYNKQFRTMISFNTGTRTFKSVKDYDRKKDKKICEKFLKNY